MKTHIAIAHEGKKPYPCPHCPSKSFTSQCGLAKHLRSKHDGPGKKKSLQCDQCEKAFYDAYTLKRHVTTVHEGLRPFACPCCSQTFPIKKNLHRHIKTKHAEMSDELLPKSFLLISVSSSPISTWLLSKSLSTLS